MPLAARRWTALAVAFLSAVSAAHAEQTLKDAYAAILNGDYAAGKQAIETLRQRGETSGELARVSQWLDSYQEHSASRDALRAQTFDWAVQNAKDALAAGKTYLALSFAVQASAYAEDARRFAAEPWVVELRQKALAAAEDFMKSESWRKAHAYYFQLERIDNQDVQAREGRERAAHHLRLEFIYDSADAVERRIADVHPSLMENAFALINDNYYDEPDFRKMADGALDQIVALAHSTKLYDTSDLFNGIANPAAREHFIGRLQELRGKLPDEKNARDYGYRDLLKLYRAVSEASRASVSLPEGMLVVEFTEGALSKLDDFTSMVWPADSTEFDKMMIGNFCGVGIQLGLDEDTGRLKVVTPLENSPALEAGIQPDDLIVEVNGVSTKDWTSEKAVREITGPEATKVTLTIFRPRTGKRLEFPLERREIQLTTIRGVSRVKSAGGYEWNYILDPDAGVALIRLTGFNPDSQKELLAALKTAQKQGMRGLILDLRYNPGGLLDVAIDIVSLFQKSGEVVATRGRRETSQTHDVTGDAPFADLPLVVLVNDSSASASEILSGALKDHQRAIVLGERTFGKGSVQRVLRLDRRFSFGGNKPAARLKLTTALYYLPSGRSPHRLPEAQEWGVDPDWVVTLTPKEANKIGARQLEAYIIHNEDEAAPDTQPDAEKLAAEKAALKQEASGDSEDEDLDNELLTEDDLKLLRADPHPATDFDAQLEAALLQLRVKIAGNLPWPQRLAKAAEDAKP